MIKPNSATVRTEKDQDGNAGDVVAARGARSGGSAARRTGSGEPMEDGTLGLSSNALTVLENRYLNRNDQGEVIESPAELIRRVAHAVAAVESKWGLSEAAIAEVEQVFFDLMAERRFMPNSPTLMNAGRRLGMLSACFVLPLDDSIPDIMETARQIALVQRAGGGTGVDLSQLRPRGSIVRSSGGTTEGPLSFLKMLSSVTDSIQQGAFRRGANMGMMRVDHPDVLDFIDIKSDLSQVTNYNLSVSMTDAFMTQLQRDPHAPHVVADPNTGRRGFLRKSDRLADFDLLERVEGGEKVDAATLKKGYWTVREVWDRIVKRAWESGEPGLIFIDEVNRHNQTPQAFEIRATNPCGEQPLGPYEACNLGSINLDAFFRSGVGGDVSDRIDWDAMRDTVRSCVRFLDDVVEVNNYPTKEIDAACRANRKIGLGVMGWADLLFHLGIRYDSEEALDLARQIGHAVREAAWDMSTELAEQRGTFPNWAGSTWDKKHDRKMRNAHTVTIAPTGTISIIAGCSGGIEPIFSLAFTRQVLGGKQLTEVNSVFRQALLDAGLDSSTVERVVDHAAKNGSVQDVESLPRELRDVYRTSRDIEPQWHVRMQAAWQENTDAAVSKTINLPESASVQDVESAYLLAHQLLCKGITVYRDGSRPVQPMALKGKEKGAGEPAAEFQPPAKPIRLPELMPCVRVRQFTPFGNMHVKISVEPQTGVEREVFAQLGKGGDLACSDLEAICRIVSLFLRCNGELSMAIGQLEGIGSSLSVPSKDGRIMSLADGLAHALRKYMLAKERFGLEGLLLGKVDISNLTDPPEQGNGGAMSAGNKNGASHRKQGMFKVKCPDCSGVLSFAEGCVKCHACGFSQC